MALKIYLIRHGETDFNKQDRDWGQDTEEALNDQGVQQVQKLAETLKEIKFDKLFSSDLTRAIQTSEILSKVCNLEIIKDKRLREYDPGEIDPSSDKWIEKYKQMLEFGMSKYDIRPFGGENIWDLIKRVRSFLEDLGKESGTIVIVTHSGVNVALINLSQGREKNDFVNIKQDNTCINILEFSNEQWRVIAVNNSIHIDQIKSNKKTFKNQKEIKEISKEYLSNKLKDAAEEIYLCGDIVSGEFGLYDRIYKGYKGSPVESYVLLNREFKIPTEWKISSIIDGVEKYEIGKIKIAELKHKVNVSIIKSKMDINERHLERIK